MLKRKKNHNLKVRMNRKIRGAKHISFDGLNFKSQLEKTAYVVLKGEGLTPAYEPKKFIIWKGFFPSVPFYTRDKKTHNLMLKSSKKIMDITYTPDFILTYKGYKIIIEMKGFENDVFPVKFKMFKKYLENRAKTTKYLLFEIFTKRELLQAIQVIKSL
jgi:hypothetical protein